MRSNKTFPNIKAHLCVVPTVAMLLFSASCVKQEQVQEKADSVPKAVSFDAYLNRGVDTRAGSPGILDGDSLGESGFGVFAFNAETFPDFMYNTRVTNPGGTAWSYFPVKYWPTKDGNGGSPAGVSFYAYAPYVPVDPVSGIPSSADDGTSATSRTSGITRISASTDNGAPSIAYKSSFLPSESVDLCWSAPVLNATRSDINSKVRFDFKHALSALNVTVDAIVDETATPPGTTMDDLDGGGSATHVFIRQVTFEGFAGKGTLSLDGVDAPQWGGYGYDESIQRTPLTIHDGLLEGLEAVYSDPSETPVGINTLLTEANGVGAGGVNSTTLNLFDGGVPSAPVFVIPNGYPLKITVVYDVETADDSLVGSRLADGVTPGHSKTVTISQPIVTSSGPVRMEAGKKYVLRLHLGFTSVKFSAEIGVTENWTELPHPANFEAVIVMGQDYYEYDVDDNWKE